MANTVEPAKKVTGYQWLVLLVAWLGWVFDSMDSTIYALVLQPALRDLLPRGGIQPTPEAISWYGGIIFSIFLVGWAAGGIAFGVLADHFGRTRVLVWTILVYAAFTGIAALSTTWWQLAAFRFVTALGIGGEWAAGAALVAEVWPESKRTKAAGWLQSAWAAGFFLAAVVSLALRNSGWRPIFVVGIGPALVALLVRMWIKESDRWVAASAIKKSDFAQSFSRIRALFRPTLLRSTLVGSGLAFVAVFGLWGATNWTPTLLRSLPDLAHRDAPVINAAVSYATMFLNVGSLAGYLSFGPLAERVGRRPVFALMCVGSLVVLPATFLAPHSYWQVMALLPLLGFFTNGIFSGFAIYFPELYPTEVRASGSGFCFNVGRILAATGPFLTGYLVSVLGGFGRAASAVAMIYIVGLVLVWFAPETKDCPLPG